MRTFLVTKEEWSVFKILCPKELMELYMNENIDFATRTSVAFALNSLGFHGLAYDFLEFGLINEQDNNYKNENAIPFIKMFLNNIKSEGISELFSKKVKNLIPFEKSEVTSIKRTTAGLWEEWELFNLLFPEEIKLLTKRDNLTAKEYMVLIVTLKTLGFCSISDDIYICEYKDEFKDDILDNEVYNNSGYYITLFLNSLKSIGMREVFEGNTVGTD